MPPLFPRRRRRPGITSIAFFELVFGRPPTDDERARLASLLDQPTIATPADAHRLLLAFDAQSYPTPFRVRATAASLRRVELDGFVLWVDADDPAVSAVITSDRGYERHVSDVLLAALSPGSTFVDVGANVGFHTFSAAAAVGPAGAVVACEPSPENCRLLRLSKSENAADNVTVLPLALDRNAGVRFVTSHLGSNAGLVPDTRDTLLAGHTTPVYATTLDDVAPPQIDVMKVDVEGAEFLVLEGGRKTIDRDRPVIIMEFSCEMVRRVSEVDPGAALQEVLDLGYRCSILDRDGRGPVGVRSAAALLADWGDPLRIEDLLLQPE